MSLKIGEKAPDFSLLDQDGKIRSLKKLQKPLVLFFYPKDNTPGCTAEACSFRDEYEEFKKLNYEVWGVSGDSTESHNQFAKTYKLPFPLLFDSNNSLRRAFRISNFLGVIPGRVTFIIDKNKTIIHLYSNLANGPAHVEESIKFIKTL